MDDEWEKDKAWFKQKLNDLTVKTGSVLNDARAQDQQLQSIIRGPSILDAYSDAELENLRITLQADIDAYVANRQAGQGKVPDELLAVTDSVADVVLRPKRTVLNLVVANQQRRSKPQLPVTAADRRRQLTKEITDLIGERDDAIKELTARNAPPEDSIQMENMFDNAIQRKQSELRKLLGP